MRTIRNWNELSFDVKNVKNVKSFKKNDLSVQWHNVILTFDFIFFKEGYKFIIQFHHNCHLFILSK